MIPTVLVVDDSLTVRMDLAHALELAGFRALPCGSLREARERLRSETIALVVLDVLLPDGDGVELLRELRTTAATAAVPVLMLSSEAEVADRVRGLQTGADDYVGKPYDTGYIVARARALVRHEQAAPTVPTVLIIDDSPTFRHVLEVALATKGYAVVIANDGEEGLRVAAAIRPTAIIVDGVMPGLDGATVIRRLRLDSALRSTPCLLLTASEGAVVELQALDAGADAFARKEDDLEVILAKLSAIMRAAGPAAAVEETMHGAKRVLVVDDSETYLQEIGAVLRAEGYDVVLARSGEQALEMVAVQAVDCILLDLVMPGLGGKETCLRVKASPVARDIPLIMVTSNDSRDAMLEGLALGADDYIAKSAELEILTARVRAQIRRKQFEDEHRRIREELLRSELAVTEARAARLLAEAKSAYADELERKNQELEAFSYSVSHDLRAPLRSIDGFSQAVLEDYGDKLDEIGRRYLTSVRAATGRMGELIDDLIELARVSRQELRRARVVLSDVANAVAADLQRREPGRTNVRFSIEPDLVVDADGRLVMVVLENLVGNAWKFTSKRAEAHIEVGAESRAGEAVHFVRDNGAGFDMAFVGQLFAPFNRLHGEIEFPGTGIGLATVRRVIERHGGRVWAEGVVGRGATVYFTIPSPR